MFKSIKEVASYNIKENINFYKMTIKENTQISKKIKIFNFMSMQTLKSLHFEHYLPSESIVEIF